MNAGSAPVVAALTGLVIVTGIGLAIGVATRMLMAGRDPAGWGATLLLGIVGAWVGSLLLGGLAMGSTLPGLIGTGLGAMVALAAVHPLRRSRRSLAARRLRPPSTPIQRSKHDRLVRDLQE